ncbi:MAG TPA: hypothetical protein VGU69_16270 [Rhizomicrobium sp.]|nr:hypothetical protein [Rhizomicrobium sp.]
MAVKIAALAVLGIIGGLLLFFGVGLLAYGLASALAPALGVAGGAALAGGVFVVPPFVWAIIILLMRRPPPPPPQQAAASNNLGLALFAAVAKETPWIAILGTGALALAQMYLGKRKK